MIAYILTSNSRSIRYLWGGIKKVNGCSIIEFSINNILKYVDENCVFILTDDKELINIYSKEKINLITYEELLGSKTASWALPNYEMYVNAFFAKKDFSNFSNVCFIDPNFPLFDFESVIPQKLVKLSEYDRVSASGYSISPFVHYQRSSVDKKNHLVYSLKELKIPLRASSLLHLRDAFSSMLIKSAIKARQITYLTSFSHKIGFGHLARFENFTDFLPSYEWNLILIAPDEFDYEFSKKVTVIKVSDNDSSVDELKNISGHLLITDMHHPPDMIIELTRSNFEYSLSIESHKATSADIQINSFDLDNQQEDENTLKGIKYHLFPRNLQKLSRLSKNNYDIKKIIVTLGGSDAGGYTEEIVNKISEIVNKYSIDLHIIFGQQVHEVQKKVDKLKNKKVTCFIDPKNFHNLISESDLIICSSGNTLLESSSLSIPCIVIPNNETEELRAKNFLKLNIFPCLSSIESISKDLLNLLENKKIISDWRQKFAKTNFENSSENVINVIKTIVEGDFK
jgi:spore coat polysaccharide biosynthesis predicted glycosyltransferase SpsG